MDRYFWTYSTGGLLAPHYARPWVVSRRETIPPDPDLPGTGGWRSVIVERHADHKTAVLAVELLNSQRALRPA